MIVSEFFATGACETSWFHAVWSATDLAFDAAVEAGKTLQPPTVGAGAAAPDDPANELMPTASAARIAISNVKTRARPLPLLPVTTPTTLLRILPIGLGLRGPAAGGTLGGREQVV